MKQRISNAQKIYKEGVRLLEDAGVEEAGLDAWHLLEHVSGITRAAYYAHPDLELDVEQEEAYFAYVRRSSSFPFLNPMPYCSVDSFSSSSRNPPPLLSIW